MDGLGGCDCGAGWGDSVASAAGPGTLDLGVTGSGAAVVSAAGPGMHGSGAAVVSAAADRTLDGLEVGASVASAAVASAAGCGALDKRRRICQRSCAAAAAAVC